MFKNHHGYIIPVVLILVLVLSVLGGTLFYKIEKDKYEKTQEINELKEQIDSLENSGGESSAEVEVREPVKALDTSAPPVYQAVKVERLPTYISETGNTLQCKKDYVTAIENADQFLQERRSQADNCFTDAKVYLEEEFKKCDESFAIGCASLLGSPNEGYMTCWREGVERCMEYPAEVADRRCDHLEPDTTQLTSLTSEHCIY